MYTSQIRQKQKPRAYFVFPVLVLIYAFLALLTSLTKFNNTSLEQIQYTIDQENVANSYKNYRVEILSSQKLAEMALEEKVGQLFMLSISGTTVTSNTKDLIQNYHIGGIVLMGNNIVYESQTKNLITSIQELASIDLLIAADQEGGLVARVPWDEARNISQPHIGTVNREDFAYAAGEDHAQALKNLDINMNLAPVLDISFIPSSSMSSRTLGASTEKVSKLGAQIIQAHRDQNIIVTVKHFPGIGRSTTDSHNKLPVIDISKEQLINEELAPFKAAIQEGADAVMVGHAKYPQIDSDYPASLSKVLITDILRGQLAFEGVIISDDLRMGALASYNDKAIEAINAGTDVLLIVDSYKNQVNSINQIKDAVENGTISQDRLTESVKRILRLKYGREVI